MMQRCLSLARRALGKTAPNPLVGSVVVKDGQIIGEGFHPGAGQPHAEVFALREAGDRAQGATIYVNLEPCNHFGRTPPCSEALVKARVANVIVGMVDPDPRVSGGGIQRLRDAGIEVIVGVEEAACRQLNEGFIHRILQRRPLGILKYAMTLDGKIATTTGHSAWITQRETRGQVYQVRSACDAVIVGGNTLRRDNPYLTTHQTTDHNPLRVVMSRSLDFPREANLWNLDLAPTLVLTGKHGDRRMIDYLQGRNIEVIVLDDLSPMGVMNYFYERGFLKVLWECGGNLAAQAIAQGAVQKIMAFIAPKIIGGFGAPSPVGDLGFTHMDQAIVLENVRFYPVGQDFLLEGYLVSNNTQDSFF
jgi:diaminohydroxyphosphoribosylaminopyrimidine deaminase/5-amino-6-(5-phosphoribosylamino)uracil reductase